jgi:hypothetical protein
MSTWLNPPLRTVLEGFKDLKRSGARSRSRTGTGGYSRGILSPLCLPFHHPGKEITRNWRLESESNRHKRLCRPRHNHSAIQPNVKNPRRTEGFCQFGAGNETRTRDPNLGKVVLYQLSYSRLIERKFTEIIEFCQHVFAIFFKIKKLML